MVTPRGANTTARNRNLYTEEEVLRVVQRLKHGKQCIRGSYAALKAEVGTDLFRPSCKTLSKSLVARLNELAEGKAFEALDFEQLANKRKDSLSGCEHKSNIRGVAWDKKRCSWRVRHARTYVC